MGTSKTRSIKKNGNYAEEKGPGPGDYDVSIEYIKKVKNRKNVLVSTSERFRDAPADKELKPNASSYDPYPIMGSLLRPTHNILLMG